MQNLIFFIKIWSTSGDRGRKTAKIFKPCKHNPHQAERCNLLHPPSDYKTATLVLQFHSERSTVLSEILSSEFWVLKHERLRSLRDPNDNQEKGLWYACSCVSLSLWIFFAGPSSLSHLLGHFLVDSSTSSLIGVRVTTPRDNINSCVLMLCIQ